MMPALARRCGAAVLAASLVFSFAGCTHAPPNDPARVGPFFTPANHTGDADLGGVRRVVLLPIWAADGTAPESAAALDGVLLTALQQEKRFEVVTLSREECRRRYKAEALASTSVLPEHLFSHLQREYAADAVLFVDLTVYNPYKPLTLGLRGKLAAIDGARLIWTFDNVYSAEAPPAANSARRSVLDRDTGVPADLSRVVLQSPSRFATYAATSMFSTLPPVAGGKREFSK